MTVIKLSLEVIRLRPTARLWFCLLPTLAVFHLAPIVGAAEPSPSFEKDVRPILLENCTTCHNAKKKKGDLDLSRFETGDKAAASEQVWQDVAERMRNKDMPPKKAVQRPTDEQREIILRWIKAHVSSGESDCSKIASDNNQSYYKGYVMSRRLTHAEYDNTIRDLTGLDLHLADMLPADGSGGEGFDTDGDALFTSAISMEKYLQAADQVVGAIFADDEGSVDPIAGAIGEPKTHGRDARATACAARERLLVARPDAEMPPREAARQVIATFARRAYRRPVEAPEIDRLMALFDRAQAAGASYESALRLALKAVLISPNFLFLVEPEPDHDGVYRLGDFPIASRLSYFIWSSMPDEELFSLAEQGKLQDADVLRGQVRRMLKDPRSIALAQNFATQWLGITALGNTVRPDGSRFPQFDDELATAERQEIVLFFDSVIRENLPLTDLLDADYTFANEKLAQLYGLDGVHGNEMRRVQLPGRERGGVLGMAAVLTTTSYPLRTSPVLRGKWVLEQLLGEHIPPPPPTAGKLPADDRQPDGLTFRQRLERHRSNPECSSCHSKMDPIGFGMENFDAIGRWRTTEGSEPVDADGVLTDGTKFTGPAELKQVLLRRKDDFLRNFSRKLLGYALGRGLNKYDNCVLDDGMKALRADEDKPESLVETIVLSTPFQYRYAKR